MDDSKWSAALGVDDTSACKSGGRSAIISLSPGIGYR